jgi:hypothetical protein
MASTMHAAATVNITIDEYGRERCLLIMR